MLRALLAVISVIVVIVCVPWLNYLIVSSLSGPRVRAVVSHRSRGFGARDQSADAVLAAFDYGYSAEIDVTFQDGALSIDSPDSLESLVTTGASLVFHPKGDSWDVIERLSRELLRIVLSVGSGHYTFFLQSFQDCDEKAQFVYDFGGHDLVFDVGDVSAFDSIEPFIEGNVHCGFAVTDTIVMRNDRLIRKIGRLKSLFYVYVVDHPRQIYNVPVTHVETDDPRGFESVGGSSSVAGNVYIGTIFTFILSVMILATAAAIALYYPSARAPLSTADTDALL